MCVLSKGSQTRASIRQSTKARMYVERACFQVSFVYLYDQVSVLAVSQWTPPYCVTCKHIEASTNRLHQTTTSKGHEWARSRLARTIYIVLMVYLLIPAFKTTCCVPICVSLTPYRYIQFFPRCFRDVVVERCCKVPLLRSGSREPTFLFLPNISSFKYFTYPSLLEVFLRTVLDCPASNTCRENEYRLWTSTWLLLLDESSGRRHQFPRGEWSNVLE